jgi:hypothetical protein
MIQAFLNAPWWQLNDFLTKGDPPLIAQILAINTIFFILFIVRRMRAAPALMSSAAIKVQVLLIIANALILFQDQIMAAMRHVI